MTLPIDKQVSMLKENAAKFRRLAIGPERDQYRRRVQACETKIRELLKSTDRPTDR